MSEELPETHDPWYCTTLLLFFFFFKERFSMQILNATAQSPGIQTLSWTELTKVLMILYVFHQLYSL